MWEYCRLLHVKTKIVKMFMFSTHIILTAMETYVTPTKQNEECDEYSKGS